MEFRLNKNSSNHEISYAIFSVGKGDVIICEDDETWNKIHNQPERSKREDDIMHLRCGKCEGSYHVFLDSNHINRCGALNIAVTQ